MEIIRASEPSTGIYLLPALEDCKLFKDNILATVVNIAMFYSQLRQKHTFLFPFFTEKK